MLLFVKDYNSKLHTIEIDENATARELLKMITDTVKDSEKLIVMYGFRHLEHYPNMRLVSLGIRPEATIFVLRHLYGD